MNKITSKDNDNIKLITSLFSSKKVRKANNLFAVEGLTLVLEAFEGNYKIEKIFLTERFFTKHKEKINGILSEVKQSYFICDSIADKITETTTPQGVFAIFQSKPDGINTIEEKGQYLILNQLQDPGNIGTIIRSAQAFGIDAIIMSEDCPDIFSSKIIRASMGGIFKQKIISCNIFEIIHKIKALGMPVYATSLSDIAKPISEINLKQPCAVILGNEGNGISEQVIQECDESFLIPILSQSLNVSIAASIVAWEMTQ